VPSPKPSYFDSLGGFLFNADQLINRNLVGIQSSQDFSTPLNKSFLAHFSGKVIVIRILTNS